MKKILTVLLVLTLSVAGLFADFIDSTKNTITLNATVGQTRPQFEISASLNNDFSGSVVGGSSLTGKDPATETNTVYFRLSQSNLSRYEKSDVTVTVEGSSFTTATAGAVTTTSSKVPEVVLKENHFGTGVNDSFEVTPGTPTNNKIVSTLNYKKASAFGSSTGSTPLLDLTYTWAPDEKLDATTYSAKITITISAS